MAFVGTAAVVSSQQPSRLGMLYLPRQQAHEWPCMQVYVAAKLMTQRDAPPQQQQQRVQ